MPENELFSKKTKFTLLLSTIIFTVFFLSGRGVLLASDASDAQVTGSHYVKPVNAVTVIGSRLPSFKVPFADIPANVSYIPANVAQKDKEAIYVTNPRTVQDTVKDLEGTILYDQVGNGVDSVFSLRGFTESSAVIVLVDGVRMNKVDGGAVDYPLIAMHDLESIQLDRGSASPIFGNNAFAGVLHITSGRPSDAPLTLFGGVEWSHFDGVNFYNGLKGTLQDKWTPLGGAFGYYFKAGRNLNDGFRDNGEYRITDFDIKTEYYFPEESGRIFVHLKHVDDTVSNPSSVPFQTFQDDFAKTIKELDGRSMDMTVLSMGGDVNFWEDRLVASILTSMRYTNIDFVTTSATFTDFPDGFNPDTDLVRVKSRSTDLITQLAYQDTWGDIHNQSVVGIEYSNQSNQALERDFFLGNIVASTATETDRTSSPESFGLYWRESLKYKNAVIVHVGMRHDYYWLKTLNELTNNPISERWRESSVSTGITGRPHESVDVFFNYSQGFRVPVVSEIAPFSGTVSTGLRPEKSDSYEVGTRVRIKDKAEIKMSYFLIDVKDEILFDSTTTSNMAPFGQNRNIGETRRYGIELRAEANPVEEVGMYASYTWTQAYVRESNPAGTFVDGRSLGQVPEHRWTLGFTAKPLKRFGEKLEGLKVGLHGTFTGKQHPSNFESTSQAVLNATGGAGHIIKPYSVWDFILAYEYKNAEVYFKINNLFDEKYYSNSVSATSFGTVIQPAGTFTFVNAGAPREFLLGARWEFDVLEDFFGKAPTIANA